MVDPNGMLASKRVRANRITSIMLLAVLGAIGAIGVGCSSGTSTASQFVAYGINAFVPAPGTTLQNGQVTLFVGGTYLGANISFGQVGSSGNPVSLTSGTYNLYASLYNANAVFAENPLVSFTGSNTPYTIIAAGEAGQSGALKPQIIVMPNYITSPLTLALTSGQAAIRVINVSLDPNPLGLYATASNVPTTSISPGLSAVPFGYSSAANPYVAVDSTTLHNMAIVDSTAPTVALGLTNSNVISNLNTQVLAAGNAYTLIIYGQPGNASTFEQLGATWVQDYPIP